MLHCILVMFHNRARSLLWRKQRMIKFFEAKTNNIIILVIRPSCIVALSVSSCRFYLPCMYLGDSTSLRTTYLVSICMQIISSCIFPSYHCWHLVNMVRSEQSKLQSQTKIVGTLPPNALSTSGPSPGPPNVGYRSSLTKSCTPTLGGQEDSKAPEQFWLRLLYHRR